MQFSSFRAVGYVLFAVVWWLVSFYSSFLFLFFCYAHRLLCIFLSLCFPHLFRFFSHFPYLGCGVSVNQIIVQNKAVVTFCDLGYFQCQFIIYHLAFSFPFSSYSQFESFVCHVPFQEFFVCKLSIPCYESHRFRIGQIFFCLCDIFLYAPVQSQTQRWFPYVQDKSSQVVPVADDASIYPLLAFSIHVGFDVCSICSVLFYVLFVYGYVTSHQLFQTYSKGLFGALRFPHTQYKDHWYYSFSIAFDLRQLAGAF